MKKELNKEVSLESMEKLARIMNDSPTMVKLKNTEFAITALKPGTQWLISEEACKIVKVETKNMTDVINQFASNFESVVRIIVLAILNDKDRIFSDYKKRVYSKEYEAMYNTILWETDSRYWIGILIGVVELLDLESFFRTTSAISRIREMALGRKKTIEEQESSSAGQNTGK